MMVGETDLKKLLQHMSPILVPEEYVFCTFTNARYGDHAELQPIVAVLEEEGLTLIVPRPNADKQGVAYNSVFRMISLGVQSSLDAIGLTAAFSSKLAAAGISANVVAGYHHDHIFVPSGEAEQAMAALTDLSAED